MKVGSFAAGLASFVFGLPVGIVLLLGGSEQCGSAGSDVPTPSAAAADAIPSSYLALYQAAGQQYGLPWTLLAAIGSVETDHGRLNAPGVRSGANSSGAMGPMQFRDGTWRAYGVDGDRDGDNDVYDQRDAIPSTANYLRASGAPGNLHDAIFAYNHAEWYVQKVLAAMRLYAAAKGAAGTPDGAPLGGCSDLGGVSSGAGSSQFTLAPTANRAGVALSATLTAYIARMATFFEGRLVVSYGTNHSQFVAGTNRESDHWQGNGADFGMADNGGTNDGLVGDAIAAAAFMAAGVPRDAASAGGRAGGAVTILSNRLRIQIIWKVDGAVGDHHDHVHVGIGPA